MHPRGAPTGPTPPRDPLPARPGVWHTAPGRSRGSAERSASEDELRDVEVAGGEPGFAVREVEVPHPTEPAVEAEFVDRFPVGVEPGAPLAQRGRVVRAERAALRHPQRGVPGEHVVDGVERRQRTAREDVLVHPRVLVTRREHAVVLEQDRLDPGASAGRQVVVDGREVGRPVLLADRLDHLDAHDRVERAVDLAVVAHLHVDPTGETGRVDAPASQRGLLLRQRDRRDRRPTLRGADRERAPAGPDLEHLRAEPHVRVVEQPVDLARLRLLQRVARLEPRARVGHRLVEEQREEFVRQVVVPRDVAPRAGDRVALTRRLVLHVVPPQSLHPQRHEHRDPLREGHEHRGGVVGVPVVGHERLAEAHQTERADASEEVVAADPHQRRSGPAAADDDAVGQHDAHVERPDRTVEQRAGDRGVDRATGRGPEPGPGSGRSRARRLRFLDGRGHCTPSCATWRGRATIGSRRDQSRNPSNRMSAVTR